MRSILVFPSMEGLGLDRRHHDLCAATLLETSCPTAADDEQRRVPERDTLWRTADDSFSCQQHRA
jgi:hypothetical protein